MFERKLNLNSLIKRKSLFLFGPRQTGKTTYLRGAFPEALYLDLLDLEVLRELNHDSSRLQWKIRDTSAKIVILDEIQKFPALLDEVHRLIELDKALRFVLTGSSARKLKREGVNLLGGRASQIHFHPLTLQELDFPSDTLSLLRFGSLPFIVGSPTPKLDLKDYVRLYLQQEIREEALVKNFLGFSRFIDFAAATNGEVLNFTSLGSDAQIAPRTVQDYYAILEDTLIGSLLRPFAKTSRKTVSSSKFYFFDLGVCNYLRGQTELAPGSDSYGRALEHWVFCELKAWQSYSFAKEIELFFWRTQTQIEVDFVVKLEDRLIAIEVKSNRKPRLSELRGLKAFKDEFPKAKRVVVCATSSSFTEAGIRFLNLNDFARALWSGEWG